MSFREISAWISLVSTVLVFGLYFYYAGVAFETAQRDLGELLGQYIGSIVLLIILQIVLFIITAIVMRNSPDLHAARDEREQLIELKAGRFAIVALQLGVSLSVMAIGVGVEPFIVANALVLTAVVGEVLRLGGQIVYFRLGV